MNSEKEKQFNERLQQLRNGAKKIKNPDDRKLRESVVKRMEIINAVFPDPIVDMNDSDVLMIVLLLSKNSFETVRKKLYRVADQMGVEKGGGYNVERYHHVIGTNLNTPKNNTHSQ